MDPVGQEKEWGLDRGSGNDEPAVETCGASLGHRYGEVAAVDGHCICAGRGGWLAVGMGENQHQHRRKPQREMRAPFHVSRLARIESSPRWRGLGAGVYIAQSNVQGPISVLNGTESRIHGRPATSKTPARCVRVRSNSS